MWSDVQIRQYLEGKNVEVQLAPCLRSRYNQFPKCVQAGHPLPSFLPLRALLTTRYRSSQCIQRLTNEICRFRGFRCFP